MRKFSCALACCTLAVFVASCGQPGEVTAPDPERTPERAFSNEDRRIAARLSIGVASLDLASPEGRALLCTIGLESIREQVQASGALSTEQAAAFKVALRTFRDRATQGYGTPEKLAEARTRAEIDYPGPTDRARLAVACLRELA